MSMSVSHSRLKRLVDARIDEAGKYPLTPVTLRRDA